MPLPPRHPRTPNHALTPRPLPKNTGLIKPIRALAFSPATTLLAAAGDARLIALYAITSGEQVATLAGHGAWITALDWSDSGEFLLSGYVYSYLSSLEHCGLLMGSGE